jgi:predicted enzyme related to lactoylglutathione lyase
MNDPFKTHGAFSWCELMTPDPEAAKRFYGTLFGWTLEGHGHGPGNLYRNQDGRRGQAAAPRMRPRRTGPT